MSLVKLQCESCGARLKLVYESETLLTFTCEGCGIDYVKFQERLTRLEVPVPVVRMASSASYWSGPYTYYTSKQDDEPFANSRGHFWEWWK